MFKNKRLLIVDDNEIIHEDIRKILAPVEKDSDKKEYEKDISALENFLFKDNKLPHINKENEVFYSLDYAFQGQDAYEFVKSAEENKRPYALVFIDIRMPLGWDGIETICNIWKEYPNTQFLISSSYSDYSWIKLISRLGMNDKFLFFKKPFDIIELKQMVFLLVKRWNYKNDASTYRSTNIIKKGHFGEGYYNPINLIIDNIKNENDMVKALTQISPDIMNLIECSSAILHYEDNRTSC